MWEGVFGGDQEKRRERSGREEGLWGSGERFGFGGKM